MFSHTHDYYTHNYEFKKYTPKEKNRKRKINKIKYYIVKAIEKISTTFLDFSQKIFNRAFNYNYTDIANELRDRLIIT